MRLRAIMAALAVTLALTTGEPARTEPKPTKPSEPTPLALDEQPYGLDHLGHDGQVSVAGAPPIGCDRCHKLDAAGRITNTPGHDACFGPCHGAKPAKRRRRGKPYPIAEDRRVVCNACHAPSALERVKNGSKERLAPFYPPYSIERDYGITFSHKKHMAPARGARGCLTCHQQPGAARRPSRTHDRCKSCHAAPKAPGTPPMTSCDGCHRAAYGPATSPHRVTSIYPVADTFSHSAHVARYAVARDKTCDGCHIRVAMADALEVPSPSSRECEACHNGETAFSTVSSDCRKCHAKPTNRLRRIAQPSARYSHQAHRDRGLAIPCDRCHQATSSGSSQPAAPNHTPCADAGCHRTEFSARAPTICGSCHVGAEPWRPLHSERTPPANTEFGARFSHRLHLAGDTPRIAAPCESCHNARVGKRELRLARDHESCAGATCHVASATRRPSKESGSAKPRATECAGCHTAGLISARDAAAVATRWSVRARFRHAPHRRETKGDKTARLECRECHDQVLASDGIADIRSPSKTRCARCHQGRIAFKLTGHGCSRCHSR